MREGAKHLVIMFHNALVREKHKGLPPGSGNQDGNEEPRIGGLHAAEKQQTAV